MEINKMSKIVGKARRSIVAKFVNPVEGMGWKRVKNTHLAFKSISDRYRARKDSC